MMAKPMKYTRKLTPKMEDPTLMTKEECRNNVFGRKWKPIYDIEWLLHEAGLKFKT